MKTSRVEVFPARFDALGRMNAFLESFCGEAKVEHDQYRRVEPVIEELFTSTV